MTQKMNINVHVVSHIKEKIVHIDMLTEAESQKLVDIDEDIAKVYLECQSTSCICCVYCLLYYASV